MTGRPIARFTTKMRRPGRRDPDEQLAKSGGPAGTRSRRALAEQRGDPAELGRRSGPHDDPRAVPDFTTVPMNAHDGRAIGEEARSIGSACFSDAASPGQHGLVALEAIDLEEPDVGRTTSPIDRSTTSPGTSSGHVERGRAPAADAVVVWWTCPWSSSTAFSERNSFTNPSPTETATITTMIPASVTGR